MPKAVLNSFVLKNFLKTNKVWDYSNFYGRGYSTIFGSAIEKKSLGGSIPLILENGKFLTDCHKKFATDGLKAN